MGGVIRTSPQALKSLWPATVPHVHLLSLVSTLPLWLSGSITERHPSLPPRHWSVNTQPWGWNELVFIEKQEIVGRITPSKPPRTSSPG